VSKEGIMLYWNDPFTAQIEIDAWLAAMDIAIGLNPTWKPNTRLSYMENTLGGIAKLAWNSFKKSISYETFEDKFNLSKGEGGVFAEALRFEICGEINREAEKEENKRLALVHLQNIKCCELRRLDDYNAHFLHFFWIYGESSNTNLLEMYFAKLPQPFDEEARKSYSPKDGDSIGTRVKHVRKQLEQYCLTKKLHSQSKGGLGSICKQFDMPSLEFGCRDSPRYVKRLSRKKKSKSYKPHRSTHKTNRRKFRKPKPHSYKPRFFRKKKKSSYPKKEPAKVKCFGCQQIGHYANNCPNKSYKDKVKTIIDECNLLVANDYMSDCFSETASFYETCSATSSDYDSSDSSE